MLSTYQRFVKTTPKPRATKKSSGELLLLLLPFTVPLPLIFAVEVGDGLAVIEDGMAVAATDMVVVNIEKRE
jgi:hypothetical protein